MPKSAKRYLYYIYILHFWAQNTGHKRKPQMIYISYIFLKMHTFFLKKQAKHTYIQKLFKKAKAYQQYLHIDITRHFL